MKAHYSLCLRAYRYRLNETEPKVVNSSSLRRLMRMANKACRSRRHMYVHVLFTNEVGKVDTIFFARKAGTDVYPFLPRPE